MSIVLKNASDKKKLAPHLALTHNELQGGAANGRNVSLLLKSENLDNETREILKRVLGQAEDVEKASYNNLRAKLNDAVQKFAQSRWDWSYVEDFDENVVVFSNSDGVYYTSYTVDGDSVVLGDEALSVNRIISYEEESGVIVLSESDAISNNVKSLVVKSFDSIASNEKIKDIFKSKYMEGKQMDELQKAHDLLKSQIEGLQKELEKANQDKQAAQDALALVEKAQAEAKAAARLEKLKEVASEDQVEELQKSLATLDDAAFETVVKSLKASKEVVEQSGLFKQSSQKEGEEVDSRQAFQEMLKSKYKVAK